MAAASDSSGRSPGTMTATLEGDRPGQGRLASSAIRPALARDDFPEPEAPTIGRIRPVNVSVLALASRRYSVSHRSEVSRSRPKKRAESFSDANAKPQICGK